MSDREDLADGFAPLDFGEFGDLDDRSPDERETDDRFAKGTDPEEMLARIKPRAAYSPDGTITVLGFDDANAAIEVRILELVETPGLRGPMGEALALRARAVLHTSLRTELGSLAKFVAFLRSRALLHIKPRHITDELLDGYKNWLDECHSHEAAPRTEAPAKKKKGRSAATRGAFPRPTGAKLTKETKRFHMNCMLTLLRIMRTSHTSPFEIRRDADLVRGGDWGRRRGRRQVTRILTRPQLKKLVRVCRREVTEITRRLEAAWAETAEGDAALPQVDHDIAREVSRLREFVDVAPPSQADLKTMLGAHDVAFPRLLGLPPAEYEAALALRYPSGRLLMPFLILFAIYYRFNPTQLHRLKKSDFSEQPSPHGARLVGQKFKNRAGKWQTASWPITDDVHNPVRMIDTLERWTALIRPQAPQGAENFLFIIRTSIGTVIDFEGKDDRLPFLRMMRDHVSEIGTPFTLKMIRPSVINLVHHLFDGDLLATAEAGQHNVQTMVDHYLSDGARKLNDEALFPAVHMMNGWLGSNGLVDPREDKRGGDRSAATPGFGCRDRYGSTMPGQRPQTLCTAYGMCGSCAQREVEVTSPRSFALVVKLRDALLRSRPRMPAESWIARWASILDELENKVWWQFPEHVRNAADLSIPDLPTVE